MVISALHSVHSSGFPLLQTLHNTLHAKHSSSVGSDVVLVSSVKPASHTQLLVAFGFALVTQPVHSAAVVVQVVQPWAHSLQLVLVGSGQTSPVRTQVSPVLVSGANPVKQSHTSEGGLGAVANSTQSEHTVAELHLVHKLGQGVQLSIVPDV
jgi:hypothetical protein